MTVINQYIVIPVKREKSKMLPKSYLPLLLLTLLMGVLTLIGGADLSKPAPLLAQSSNPPPLQNILQVSAGSGHTCVRTTEGAVKCWGANRHGQLGDGTTVTQDTAVAVHGLPGSVAVIAAGGGHTCAVTTAGGVLCWGANASGQLGDGTTEDRKTPVAVQGLGSGVSALAAGSAHTCAVLDGGGVKCWGFNEDGQLGDGTTVNKSIPTAVSGLNSGVIAIAAGVSHTCALTVDGGVKCWGYQAVGLGDGTTTYTRTPVAVSGLNSGVIAIVTGYEHTCALITGGIVQCWGENRYGAVGDGTSVDKRIPVTVNTLADVTALAAGDEHTCALTAAGDVYCWGNNQSGQLGDRTTIARLAPVAVSGANSTIAAIMAGSGSEHTCALTTAETVLCWGNNRDGQLGNDTADAQGVPVTVSGLSSGVITMTAGYEYTCAVNPATGIQCWGDNYYGQLGNGTTNPSAVPVAVSGIDSGAATIAAGYGAHTCLVSTSGGVKCWGGSRVIDGTENDQWAPVDIPGLSSNVAMIAAGGSHTCVLMTSGGVKCWGYNANGQLGNGTVSEEWQPIVNVSGLGSGITQLATKRHHTCALTTAGAVMCWGGNATGELGNGTNEDQPIPVTVHGLSSSVAAIAVGGYHTCALTKAGGVYCWGYNRYGQLGDGTTVDRNTPVAVSGLSHDVVALAAGANHSCAIMTAGSVHCWGYNGFGQLGDGTTENRTTPVNVKGLASSASAVAAGGVHTCAVVTDGVQCWGDGREGQLGNGNAWRTLPVTVLEVDATTSTPTPTPTNTPTASATATLLPTVPATPTEIPTATPTVVTVRVEGQVLDQATGVGMADVLMTLSGDAELTGTAAALGGQVYTTTTDLNGDFVFPAVNPGAYTLTGVKAGIVIEAPALITVSGSQPIQVPALLAITAPPKVYLPLVNRE